MQRFDLTQTGGFPLTQDRLKWLQDGYIGAINALAAASNATSMCVLSGVEIQPPSLSFPQGSVTDGWVYDPTHGVLPFFGGGLSMFTLGAVVKELKTPLVFKNNSSQLVQITKCASLQTISFGAQTIQQLVDNRFWKVFQQNGREQNWAHLNNTAFGHTFDIYLKKDSISNILKIRGTVQVAANINPPYTIQVFATPADYIPATELQFHGVVRYVSNQHPINTVTNQRIKSIGARITVPGFPSSTSLIMFELEPCAQSYTVVFNSVLNLD